jgi:ribosomal protein L9
MNQSSLILLYHVLLLSFLPIAAWYKGYNDQRYSGVNLFSKLQTTTLEKEQVLLTPKNKVRVKLLKPMEKLGNAGDVIFVSFPMYMNVLAPQNVAVKMSDSEMKMLIEKVKEKQEKDQREITECIEAMKKHGEYAIKKSMGPTQQLFGSVTKRTVTQLLAETFLQFSTLINDPKWLQINYFATNLDSPNPSHIDEIRQGGKYEVSLTFLRYHNDANTLSLTLNILADDEKD